MATAKIDATQRDDPTAEELSDFDLVTMRHEGMMTETWAEQRAVEQRVFLIRRTCEPPVLLREKHVSWLLRSVEGLPASYQALSSSQGWIAFWIVHALDLLGATLPVYVSEPLVQQIASCWDEESGGFGGGPGQVGHMATTYASVAALCTIGTQSALASINVPGLERFIKSMKRAEGGWKVSVGGETDIRAMYSALAVSSMVGLLEDGGGTILNGCGEYVRSLQAFDGGLGGEPGTEAHGGNTYCGVASLVIAGQLKAIDVEAVLDWAVMRQMNYEGGFQGRTNKLVDSCYSFWVGATFPLLSTACEDASKTWPVLFDGDALQKYVLECCQVATGGLRDKPGTPRDFLHTCYGLSGLSIAQHYGDAGVTDQIAVRRTDPVHNLCDNRLETARSFFRGQRRQR